MFPFWCAQAIFLIVSVMIPDTASGLPPLASTGALKATNADAFRKGYKTKFEDEIDQSNLDNSIRTYDRASRGAIAEKDADIAVDPLLGYGTAGSLKAEKSLEYDRGALAVNRSRDVHGLGKVASVGVDVGAVANQRKSAAQIAGIGGIPSAGAHEEKMLLDRHQDVADAQYDEQSLKAVLTDEERYDRGVKNAAVASKANIVTGGIASGASSADIAVTHDRAKFINTIPDAGITIDTRSAASENRAINDASSRKYGEGAAIIGGFGIGAAGREKVAEDARTHQAAFHKGDVTETHDYTAGVEKHLDSDWLKASKAAESTINGLAGAGSGTAAKQYAAGYDRSDTLIDLANNVNKRSSSESVEFDDRHNVRADASKSVLV